MHLFPWQYLVSLKKLHRQWSQPTRFIRGGHGVYESIINHQTNLKVHRNVEDILKDSEILGQFKFPQVKIYLGDIISC